MGESDARRRGLLLALGAFTAWLVAPLLPVASLAALLLTLAAVALLARDARARGSARGRRMALLALGLVVASVALTAAQGVLAQRALAAGDFRGWVQLGWLYAAGTVALAGAYYAIPLDLAGDRARLLLGLALGVAVAVAASSQLTAGPAGDRFVEGGQRVLNGTAPGNDSANAQVAELQQQYAADTSNLAAVQVMPYVVFAWAYSTTLGAVIRQARQASA